MVVVIQEPQALNQLNQTNGDGKGCGEGFHRCPILVGIGIHDIQQQVKNLARVWLRSQKECV